MVLVHISMISLSFMTYPVDQGDRCIFVGHRAIPAKRKKNIVSQNHKFWGQYLCLKLLLLILPVKYDTKGPLNLFFGQHNSVYHESIVI